MKTDRELMELAARAVGLNTPRYVTDGRRLGWAINEGISVEFGPTSQRLWNPRDDDGDSRRLEVALRLCVDVADEHVRAMYGLHTAGQMVEHTEPFGRDPHAATRLAVLRVAAEVGEAMP
jgi:hypothetical protein